MKSQVLHTVWCDFSGEAAGEIWNWSLRSWLSELFECFCCCSVSTAHLYDSHPKRGLVLLVFLFVRSQPLFRVSAQEQFLKQLSNTDIDELIVKSNDQQVRRDSSALQRCDFTSMACQNFRGYLWKYEVIQTPTIFNTGAQWTRSNWQGGAFLFHEAELFHQNPCGSFFNQSASWAKLAIRHFDSTLQCCTNHLLFHDRSKSSFKITKWKAPSWRSRFQETRAPSGRSVPPPGRSWWPTCSPRTT